MMQFMPRVTPWRVAAAVAVGATGAAGVVVGSGVEDVSVAAGGRRFNSIRGVAGALAHEAAPWRPLIEKAVVVPEAAFDAAAAFLSQVDLLRPSVAHAAADEEEDADEADAGATKVEQPGLRRPDLPTYLMSEVKRRQRRSPTDKGPVWVVYKEAVYDITDFIEDHPGGKRILLASGGSIQPFWAIFQGHHSEHVYEQLAKLRIGNLDKKDYEEMLAKAAAEGDANDPYANDPKDRNVMLTVRNQKPFCAEPDPAVAIAEFQTNTSLHYIRNHLPVPTVKDEDYVLEIEMHDGRNLTLTLEELKAWFPKADVLSTIQCVGNRAQSLKERLHIGTFYGTAISTSVWSGARLRDVLVWAGIDARDHPKDRKGHVVGWVNFEAMDNDGQQGFTGSVPFEKAMSYEGDALLAYEQNGEPLTRDHGAPVRVILPGYCGVRNVKWLKKMQVSSEESEATFGWEKKGLGQRVLEWPVQSYIVEPAPGSSFSASEDECFEMKGYAFAGGGRRITRVEVSWDDGETWMETDLEQADQPPYQSWAWTLWSVLVDIEDIPEEIRKSGDMKLTVRAFDVSFNTQPKKVPQRNIDLGCACNPWHVVPIKITE